MDKQDPWAGIFLNRKQEWGTESDEYIRGMLDSHTPALQQGDETFKGHCLHCDYTREPCDTASVAATALVRIDALTEARAQLEAALGRETTLRKAFVRPLPEGTASELGGYFCTICNWEADEVGTADFHNPTCPLGEPIAAASVPPAQSSEGD